MSAVMMMLLGLFLVPVSVFIVVRRRYPRLLYTLTGLSFGSVIAPASIGLYGLFYLPLVGLVPGMLGLVLSLIHGVPGYEISTSIGVVESNSVVEGSDFLIVHVVDGLVWGGVYGALGFAIDKYRKSNSDSPTEASGDRGRVV